MDTTDKILRAFIFRLLLLVLAVFAARHLPDHGLRTVRAEPVALAAADQVECALETSSFDKANDKLDDMLLHD
ncbi:hypothetical protein ACIQUB_27315 [Rhizobium sp. NPDC090275]|uniref:hypothetical protein n=1 Tax=Rhizobium sp. NPDC090275 TaxID=3364498 RepID=UPI00383BDBDE